MDKDVRTGRTSWQGGLALILLLTGGLAILQATGYWARSALTGEPTKVLFVDHSGPGVTSALVGIAALGLGVAALRRGQGP